MTTILLNEPVPVSDDRERINYFSGRSLGEEEFDRRQAYADKRLSSVLNSHIPGIVSGLEVNITRPFSNSESFGVNPGLAIDGKGQTLGLYYPIKQTWKQLYQDYLNETGAASAAGVFYITLRRRRFMIDGAQDVDPCQRTDLDPTRDTQRVVLGTLGLHRLGINPDVLASQDRGLIENWAVANQLNGQIFETLNHAVPIGLVAFQPDASDFKMLWFSQTAGRYLAEPQGSYRTLFDQVIGTFRRKLNAAQSAVSSTVTLADFLDANLKLDFLPAAGQLPLQFLQDPASPDPSVLWLPKHLHIDMVPIPEEAAPDLIQRHLPRRTIDLREPMGERIRLLLAVNETDYRSDLLDIPQIDSQLASQLYKYFMRSRDSWIQWHKKFDELYFMKEEDVLDEAQKKAIDFPIPVVSPPEPSTAVGEIIEKARAELRPDASAPDPYPFSQGVPTPPAFFTNWLRPDPANPAAGPVPPVPPKPVENGLVVKFALTEEEIEKLDNRIRATRTRLEKTRDYLLLQRQQLDSQTVSLAALAGGVAGDGSGLQVARWLPYTELKKPLAAAISEERTTSPATDDPGSGGGGGSGGSSGRSTFGASELLLSRDFAANTSMFAALADTADTSTGSKRSDSRSSSSRSKATSGTESLLASFDSRSFARNPLHTSVLEITAKNKKWLNQLAARPTKALTLPAFTTKESRFGVIEHIAPEHQEYKMAYRGMAELMTTLDGLFDPKDAKKLKAKLRGFGTLVAPDKLTSLDESTGDAATDKQNAVQARYQALFRAGKILTSQIAYIETRYNTIEARLQFLLRQRINKEGELNKLAALIRNARRYLASLDQRRVERLGDYGVAQRLLDDDWYKVHADSNRRTQILTRELRGLYYVKERQVAVSLELKDPLALRHASSDDLVPGCDADKEPVIPDDLDEFLTAIMEIPIADWRDLRSFKSDLPGRRVIDSLFEMKLSREKSRKRLFGKSEQGGIVQSGLHTIRVQNISVFQQFSRKTILPSTNSIVEFHNAANKTLSLRDALTGGRFKMRNAAQKLSGRLEQCISCLLEKLIELPPSLRFQWAQLAEDDRLELTDITKWPGLERAERDDFNVTRTVAELVNWWFRQLIKRSSGAGKAAMRNMLRAILIHASLGDPAEIIQGRVHVPPRIFNIGQLLRLKLNRTPRIGAPLQLLDKRQRIVGMLSVKDHDKSGTLASIVRVDMASAKINTGFSVVAGKSTSLINIRHRSGK